jgi:hypothetical protein
MAHKSGEGLGSPLTMKQRDKAVAKQRRAARNVSRIKKVAKASAKVGYKAAKVSGKVGQGLSKLGFYKYAKPRNKVKKKN